MKVILLIAGLVLFTGGCLQVEYRFDIPDNRNLKVAEIIYAGAPEVDGCSWLIRIDDTFYHPENLADNFKTENLPVMVDFIETREIFRCGRGGVSYKTIRILQMEQMKTYKEVAILQENQWDELKMDRFRMDSVYVDGDTLRLKVSYSGGCREHTFKLWKLPPNALVPPPVELLLDHDAHGDMCEAWLTKWLAYSLKPIRVTGKHEVTFLMRGSPEMSAYFGKFVYKY
jgi:glutaredoxin-related protein